MDKIRKKGLWSLLLIFAGITMASIGSFLGKDSHFFIVEGIEYSRLGGDSVEVVDNSTGKYSGTITVPPTIIYHDSLFRVVGIGENVFTLCADLESLSIEEGVRYIGDFAFINCWGLTHISIPESVTRIGDHAFCDCDALSEPVYNSTVFAYLPKSYTGEYVIPEGIRYIAGSAFFDCDSLTNVVLPESVTHIGPYAFRDTQIKQPLFNSHVFALLPKDYEGEYNIPEGITSVAGAAFSCCEKLTKVTLPESVTEVGLNAFRNCSLDEPVSNSFLLAYIPNRSDNNSEFVIPSGIKVLAEGLFYEHSYLEKVTIPEGVTTISREAFSNCSNLREVNIPNSVTRIEERAFSKCHELKSIDIPNTVTYIGKDAFEHTGLTSVTIPESVEIIDKSAFSGCDSLKFATIKSRKTIIRDCAFDWEVKIERPFFDKLAGIPASNYILFLALLLWIYPVCFAIRYYFVVPLILFVQTIKSLLSNSK